MAEPVNEKITAARLTTVAHRGRRLQDEAKQRADRAAAAYNQRTAADRATWAREAAYRGTPEWRAAVRAREAARKEKCLARLKTEQEQSGRQAKRAADDDLQP